MANIQYTYKSPLHIIDTYDNVIDTYFWIHDEEEGDEKNAVRIYSMENGKPKLEIVKIFSGYKLPVLIVRKRNQ